MPTLQANGIRIAYEDAGDGPPAVLLGGSGMDAATWNFSVMPMLVEAGYRVIALDNRGSGGSEAPPPPYSISGMALDTIGLIEGLGLPSCRLVGLSMGGFIVEEVCHQRPDLIHASVLIASAGRTTAYMKAKLKAEAELLALGTQALATFERIDALTVTLPPQTLQNDDAAVAAWQELLTTGVGHPNEDGHLGQGEAMRRWLLDDTCTERWAQLGVPCRVVNFEHDLQFPPSRGREAAEAIPAASFVEIAGVAHGNGPFDAATDLARVILEFFADVGV